MIDRLLKRYQRFVGAWKDYVKQMSGDDEVSKKVFSFAVPAQGTAHVMRESSSASLHFELKQLQESMNAESLQTTDLVPRKIMHIESDDVSIFNYFP